MSNTSDRLLDGALNTIRKMSDYIQTGQQEVQDLGIELLENNVDDPNIKSLQDCIVELVKAEQRVKTFTNSVNELKRSWKDGDLDESVDVVEVLQKSLKEQEEKSFEEDNIWDHEFMITFVNQMKELGGGALLETRPSANDDMELTQRQVSLKCPITQIEMTDPVKDKACGHSFQRDAILTHIKQCEKRRKSAKCPYPGCKNNIMSSSLEPDAALMNLIKRKTRTAMQ